MTLDCEWFSSMITKMWSSGAEWRWWSALLPWAAAPVIDCAVTTATAPTAAANDARRVRGRILETPRVMRPVRVMLKNLPYPAQPQQDRHLRWNRSATARRTGSRGGRPGRRRNPTARRPARGAGGVLPHPGPARRLVHRALRAPAGRGGRAPARLLRGMAGARALRPESVAAGLGARHRAQARHRPPAQAPRRRRPDRVDARHHR